MSKYYITTPKHSFHDYSNVGQCPKLSHVVMKTILSTHEPYLMFCMTMLPLYMTMSYFWSRLLLHD
jgi:hypothetical protein